MTLFKKQEDEIVALFDIGNGSIGGALVALSKTGIPTVLYTHREPISYIEHLTSKRLLDTMLILMKSVVSHIQKEGLPYIKTQKYSTTIKHSSCVVSSPWYISQTKTITVKNEKPFLITNTLIKDLIKKEEDDFLVTLKNGNYESQFGKDTRLLEKKIIQTKLNGYEVEHSLDKKVRELEITFFSSFISQTIIKAVEDSLSHFFHFKSVNFHSYALASWSVLRDMNPAISDFLILDITGEVTDIMIVERGVLSQTVSFPLGRTMIVRKLVDDLHVSSEVAVSFLSLVNQKTIEKEFEQKIKNILKSSQDFWLAALFKTLQDVRPTYVIPNKIFITVDTDCAHIFSEIIPSMYEVVIMNEQKVNPLAHILKGIQKDSFLSIESHFLNKVSFDIV